MSGNVKNVIAAIGYIESHLHEKPGLEIYILSKRTWISDDIYTIEK